MVEVDRPNRQTRRRTGKSDPADAVEAARAALSGRAQGAGKTRDGNVEAIRALVVAKRSARSMRIASLNQIRHLGFPAPDELRDRLRGVSRDHLGGVAAGLRPRAAGDSVMSATKTAIRILGRRVLALDAELAAIDALLAPLVAATAPPPAHRARRRRRLRRHPAGRRRRQPATLAFRSGVGASVRGRSHPGVVGQDEPAPPQPRWRS